MHGAVFCINCTQTSTEDILSKGVGTLLSSRLLLDEARFFDLGVEEFLQQVGTLVVLALRGVIFPTVGEDALHVSHEQLARCVVPALQALAHCLKVCMGRVVFKLYCF